MAKFTQGREAMNLTNEQIQQILDGAPDGATHYAQGMRYLTYNSGGNWMRYDPNGIGGFCWFDANEFKLSYTKSFHSLTDLEEILTLRQEVERLEANLASKTEIGNQLKDELTEAFIAQYKMATQFKERDEIIKAVAHIGVDFGYGNYELEQKHIDKARELLVQKEQSDE